MVTWHDFLNLMNQNIIMENINEINSGKKGRKDLRKTIAAKLENSLEEFRGELKEKKFKAAIKRASKLLANDLYVKAKKKKEKAENNLSVVEEEIGA